MLYLKHPGSRGNQHEDDRIRGPHRHARRIIVRRRGGRRAADYPNKPIRVVIGFPRAAWSMFRCASSQKPSDAWKRQVAADNRPGAGGVIAAQS
jgi:hypothetical protein